jgi:hypothetical protein
MRVMGRVSRGGELLDGVPLRDEAREADAVRVHLLATVPTLEEAILKNHVEGDPGGRPGRVPQPVGSGSGVPAVVDELGAEPALWTDGVVKLVLLDVPDQLRLNRLLTKASGPEIVDFCPKPKGKGGGRSPSPFLEGFAAGGAV